VTLLPRDAEKALRVQAVWTIQIDRSAIASQQCVLRKRQVSPAVVIWEARQLLLEPMDVLSIPMYVYGQCPHLLSMDLVRSAGRYLRNPEPWNANQAVTGRGPDRLPMVYIVPISVRKMHLV